MKVREWLVKVRIQVEVYELDYDLLQMVGADPPRVMQVEVWSRLVGNDGMQ